VTAILNAMLSSWISRKDGSAHLSKHVSSGELEGEGKHPSNPGGVTDRGAGAKCTPFWDG